MKKTILFQKDQFVCLVSFQFCFENLQKLSMQQSQIDKISNFFSRDTHQKDETSNQLGEQAHYHSKSPEHAEYPSESLKKLHADRTNQIRRQHNRKYNPYAFTKLPDEQKVRTFLSLYEDLIHTKAKLQDEVQNVKQLKTKLHKIENDFVSARRLGEMTAPEKVRVEKEKDQEYLQMKNENRRLIEKINSLTLPKRVMRKTQQIVVQKKQQKTAFPVNQQLVVELNEQKATVKSLLEMISSLKKDKLALEEQLKERQRMAGNMSQSGFNKNQSRMPQRVQVNTNFEEVLQELALEKEKKLQLEMSYQRLSTTTSEKIRSLTEQLQQERESRAKREKEQNQRYRAWADNGQEERIVELTRERDKYEAELRRMVESPFYVDHKDQFNLQNKVRELETKLRSRENEITNLKESGVKVFSELEFKKKEAASLKDEVKLMKKENLELKEKELGKQNKLTTDLEDYYRKALHLAKWQGDDPIWKKYSTLAKPQFELLNPKDLRQLSEKMWLQKLELLAHLQKAQSRLRSETEEKAGKYLFLQTQKAKLQEKLNLALKKIDEYSAILSMKKGYSDKIYTQHGVQYDDSVSVFDVDEDDYQQEIKHLEASENYLDLYIGQMLLQDLAVSQQVRGIIRDVKNLMSFLTVDFYNHDTDHTNVAEGLRYDFRYRMSFKVQVDQTLINYLQRDTIKIELWGSEGSAAPLIGTASITLKQLIARSQDSVSPVVHSKVPVYGQEHVLLGVIDYRVRMRLPISPLLKWIKERRTGDKIEFAKEDIVGVPDARRRLSIIIERALNLPDDIEAFVYFVIQQQDCYSQPEKGPAPMWDYHRQLDIIYSQEFQQQLKTKYVQFTVFDDRKPMGQDVYGVAQVDLTPLLSKNAIQIKADIKNLGGLKSGVLMLKAAWM